jgi:hypothetical protein
MSILSAIKQQSGSIEDLAKLPQTMIMQMAQRKEIVPEMVPVILGKKAEMIDRAAKAKAAQGGIPQQSIMDQVMASNAQAENPQAMGQMPPPMPQQNQMAQRPQMMQQPQQPQGPADVGIASNPVPPMQLAGGGIIAFAEGDQVKAPKSNFPKLAPNAGRDEFRTFLEEQVRNNMTDTTDPFAESKAMSQQYSDELKNRSGQDMNMALLNTAAGMMAGDSPYFFTNVGKGAQEGAKSLATSNQQRQADKRLLLQQKVEAEKAAEARKAQRSLGAERNLTDMYNRDAQGQATELSAQAQIMAAQIGRIPTPSEFDKYSSKISALEKQDPDGKLGLVPKFNSQVKEFYSNRTVSDESSKLKAYDRAEIAVEKSLLINPDPKYTELIKKGDTEGARKYKEALVLKAANNALDYSVGKTGGGSGKYSNMSNDELMNLLKK